MLESFIIMLREGVEAALVIGILLVVLRKTERRDLERPVFWGLGLAILASIGAAVALHFLPINREAYEGVLYWTAAVFVASMMWWMHRKAKTIHSDIEQRVQRAAEATGAGGNWREMLGLGAFAFLMIFREGAEAVLFLSAVSLTTDAMLSFLGSVLGLAAAVIFCVMFIRGSLQVNIGRFFKVTEWVLAIFIAQLVVNGYHEFSEAEVVPATQQTMALVGPIVRHNSLFILAIVAIPLFIWLTQKRSAEEPDESASEAERRLAAAKARRETLYRYGAVFSALIVLGSVGVLYAREMLPKDIPPPERVVVKDGAAVVPREKLEDGKLHRLGLPLEDRTVRFLAMKTSDGKIRTALDACEICGTFGYIQDGRFLLCLNCAAEINPVTLGIPGGCNPIPLEATVTADEVRVPLAQLQEYAGMFAKQTGRVETDPVCSMRVRVNQAAAFEKHEGTTYYFCSKRCHRMFTEEPKAYTE